MTHALGCTCIFLPTCNRQFSHLNYLFNFHSPNIEDFLVLSHFHTFTPPYSLSISKHNSQSLCLHLYVSVKRVREISRAKHDGAVNSCGVAVTFSRYYLSLSLSLGDEVTITYDSQSSHSLWSTYLLSFILFLSPWRELCAGIRASFTGNQRNRRWQCLARGIQRG